MTGSFWVYLVAAILVLAVNAVAVYVAWRALFHDRADGRRRCPRCWHDLSGTPGTTCGECGHRARHERELGRTRRHWTLASLAILVCVSVAGWVYWKLDNRSWTAYVPTPVLTTLLPLRSDASSVLFRELSRRAQANRLTDAQWSALLRRSARGDWWSRPPEDEWVESYGRLIEAGRWRLAADPEANWDDEAYAALLEIPPRLELSTREAWPVGAPARVRLRMRDWWPLGGRCRLRITPRVEGGQTYRVQRADRAFLWYDYSFPLPRLDGEDTQVPVDVEVQRDMTTPPADGVGPPAPSRWQTMSRSTHEVEIAFADDAEVGLTPVDGRALTRAVSSTFSRGAVQWQAGPKPVRFFFNPQETYHADFDDTAIGVHVDLLDGDRLARRLDIWWLAGSLPDDRGIGWEATDEDLDLLRRIDEGGAWSMRITGNPRLALRAGDAARYWDGQFIIPLRVQRNDGAAPAPLWTAEDDDADGT